MKTIKEDKAYIELHDLYKEKLPDSLIPFVSKKYKNDELIEITGEDNIEYVNNRSDVLDYEYVKNLDEKELHEYALSLNKKFDSLCWRYLKSSQYYRRMLDKDTEYNKEYKKYKYMYVEIQRYINNKEEIDNKFSQIESKKIYKKIL